MGGERHRPTGGEPAYRGWPNREVARLLDVVDSRLEIAGRRYREGEGEHRLRAISGERAGLAGRRMVILDPDSGAGDVAFIVTLPPVLNPPAAAATV